jgi:hypothetical protein
MSMERWACRRWLLVMFVFLFKRFFVVRFVIYPSKALA